MNTSIDLLPIIIVAAYFGFVGAIFGTVLIEVLDALLRRILSRHQNLKNQK